MQSTDSTPTSKPSSASKQSFVTGIPSAIGPSTNNEEFGWDRLQLDPEVLHTVETTNSHQYIQLPVSASKSSSSKNAHVEVPPQLREIVAWSHTTLPNSAGALTVNGVVPKVVIVDTGAKYVMIGKQLAEHMELSDADLFEGIKYNTTEGESHKSRGVTKRKVGIVLRPGQADEAKVFLHVMVDNATTYDILLGAQWIHRIGGIINTRSDQLLYRPD